MPTPILHLALSTQNLEQSIADLSQRFASPPQVVVPGIYALWRTAAINCSVRVDLQLPTGTMRHLGWEDDSASAFSSDVDCHGITWERFSAAQQFAEIGELWPDTRLPEL